MADFGDLDDFAEHEVQGRPIKAYKNGYFDNPKTLFVQPQWTWDDFLCFCSQRLEMVPMASRVFNSDGAEIDDIMCIEEGDMLFFSAGAPFKVPGHEENGTSTTEDIGVVGGYRVTTLLGRGGFGEVRLGVHQLTNEKVALKFILKNEMGSLGDVERTTTEIQCLTALNHPSIIKLIRVFNEPNHVVLVFELLEGGDLYHHLVHLPPGGLSEEESVHVFSQILAGVGYAHNQHICHRDLKLENILLQSKNDLNSVKIADFGLSDFYRPGAMAKTTCGSISYLPPEVFRGTSNAGPPLDVWSLGVILFAIVCGRLPFEGSDLKGTNRPRENVIRNRIMRAQYKLDEHLSAEVADLIMKMLKLDPAERATIPEIFNHPWIRGKANCLSLDGMMTGMSGMPSKDDDDDMSVESFSLVKKDNIPGGGSVLPPAATAATPTSSIVDDDAQHDKGLAKRNPPPLVSGHGSTLHHQPSSLHPPPIKRPVRNDTLRHSKSPRSTATAVAAAAVVASSTSGGSSVTTMPKVGSDKHGHITSTGTMSNMKRMNSTMKDIATPKAADKMRRVPPIHVMDERLASSKTKRRASTDADDPKLEEALEPIN